MRTHAKLLSATLGAAVLAMTACSDGDTTLKDPNQVNSIFGDDAREVDSTAWQMPTDGVYLYTATSTGGSTWQQSAKDDARPGTSSHNLLTDESSTDDYLFDVWYEPVAISNGDGDANFGAVRQGALYYESEMAQYDHSALFAKSEDGAIYWTYDTEHDMRMDGLAEGKALIVDEKTWNRYLPASTSDGTSWAVTLGALDDVFDVPMIGGGTEVAFAYKDQGAISYNPHLRRNDGSIVQSDGSTEATELEEVGIFYLSADASYDVEFIDANEVRVVGYNVIVDDKVDVLADDGTTVLFKDAIQVQTTYRFRPVATFSDMTIVGMDEEQLAASETWYWKKGHGVVKSELSISISVVGYDEESLKNNESDAEDHVSAYNVAYDNAYFVTYADMATPSKGSSKGYEAGYAYGYDDGHKDSEIRPDRAEELLDALNYDNLSDNDTRDGAQKQAFRTAFLAGYTKGRSIGASEYAVLADDERSYNAALEAYITDEGLAAGTEPADLTEAQLDDAHLKGYIADSPYDSDTDYDYGVDLDSDDLAVSTNSGDVSIGMDEVDTKVDTAYMANDFWGDFLDDGVISQTSDNSATNWDNWLVNASYAHGIDGWGVQVVPYDNSVTSLADAEAESDAVEEENESSGLLDRWEDVKKPIKEDNQDVLRYIALPTIGVTYSRTIVELQTENPAGLEASN